jgi:hypothetical protein
MSCALFEYLSLSATKERNQWHHSMRDGEVLNPNHNNFSSRFTGLYGGGNRREWLLLLPEGVAMDYSKASFVVLYRRVEHHRRGCQQ